VWPGTFGLLLGSFFFLFSFGVFEWEQMSELWPVFPLIAGLAFLATWIAGGLRDTGLLVPAVIAITLGTVGLGFELGAIDARTIGTLWPLALVVLGALMIVRALRRTPRAADLTAESSRRDE
jgi:hypothetical protein